MINLRKIGCQRKSRKQLQAVFFLFMLLAVSVVSAQKTVVKATMDSTEIWIGQQTPLRFEVTQPAETHIDMPLFSDTIVGNLEIVEQAVRDTMQVSDQMIQVEIKYVVTSFEDSLLYVPPVPFVLDNETIWSNSMSLRVIQPFEIDTISNSLTDIKTIYKPDFDWKRFLQRLLLTLLLIALVVVLIFLLKKYMPKKGVLEEKIVKKPVTVVPAHVEAIAQLDALKEKQLWQKGRYKEYHTELTDILRIYIDKMFNIRSMEMTSDEILLHTSFLQVDKSGAYSTLRQILSLADLVKFARWNPAPNDNEMSLMNAYLFVNQTKIEEVKTLEELSKELKTQKEL